LQYLIWFAGAVVIIGILFYLNKDRIYKRFNIKQKVMSSKVDTNVNTESVLPPITARIYDKTTTPRSIYNKEIPGKDALSVVSDNPNYGLGRQWNHDGKWVYALYRSGVNKYEPVEKYLTTDRINPPSQLYGFLVQPEIAITHDVQGQKTFMQEYGKYIPWGVAIAFIIFMMVTNHG
jgi:hypothetical protein